jgi:ketosteroid isomerase-like protein
MELSPEQQERIAREERLRIEEEMYRTRVREQIRRDMTKRPEAAATPTRRNRVRDIVMPVLFGIAVLAALTFFMGRRGGDALPTDQDRRASVGDRPETDKAPGAVFGGKEEEAAKPASEIQDETAQLPGDRSQTPQTEAARAQQGRPVPQPVEPTQQRSRTEPISVNSSRPVSGSGAELESVVHAWADALNRGDVNRHVSFYAPRLERYFGATGVSRDAIAKDKRRVLGQHDTFQINVSDVRVESVEGDRAVVTFRKEWNSTGGRPFAGAERSRLVVANLGGEWKIVGEKEQKVYWVKRK